MPLACSSTPEPAPQCFQCPNLDAVPSPRTFEQSMIEVTEMPTKSKKQALLSAERVDDLDKVTASMSELEIDDKDRNCIICMCDEPDLKLACGHLYHGECILGQLKAGHNGVHITFKFACCGICRSPISISTDVSKRHPTIEMRLKNIRKSEETILVMAQERAIKDKLILAPKGHPLWDPSCEVRLEKDKSEKDKNKEQSKDEDTKLKEINEKGQEKLDAIPEGKELPAENSSKKKKGGVAQQQKWKFFPGLLFGSKKKQKEVQPKIKLQKKKKMKSCWKKKEKAICKPWKPTLLLSRSEANKLLDIFAFYNCVDCKESYCGGKVECSREMKLDETNLRCKKCTW
eukprot:CAMPEP_0114505604 /NCGR_PEP_ID=MMETSP0109-20121206/10946_1 /TAXON_ID=29199 /ORGANISM="Chlorarachnion reptans, Strain CCCM449" /LENGTH=344 /DNA_ID=CAMNT_0001684063 /DNA_START=40 /DNA_END=1071 /DNA_ORIENTATION=+